METFDYIIVGAGSAGSVIANRLSESGKYSVLLLEAGVSDQRLYVQMPIGYGKVYYDKRVNWKYTTEPVPGLGNRSSYWPRGKVLGGSSSINAMVYVRGHQHDYEQWQSVADGWGWSDVEPYFKKMECWLGAPSKHRGADGPLPITDITNEAHPLCSTYLEAAKQIQLPIAQDYNGPDMEGASLYQITTANGLRASTARCYLRPAINRSALTVRTQSLVVRLNIENRHITGVDYQRRGKTHRVEARREVILSGGAINSPQLLQLSGIGPLDVLQKAGVTPQHEMAAVGRHLKDHLGADIVCRTNVPTLNQALQPWHGKLRAGLEFVFKRRGPLTLSLNQAGGFVRSHPDVEFPDLQLYFSPVSYTRAPIGKRPLINPDPFPGFLIGFNPCKPTSEGYLNIATSNPLDAPEIHPNYLATEHDNALMLEGMKLCRDLLATPAFKSVVEDEIYPGRQVVSDEKLTDFIKDNAWTVFHPCGTCRMGISSQTSVVDNRLRVHGMTGLRIADASVFPTITTGNTNAPSIMVGEKASDLIKMDQ